MPLSFYRVFIYSRRARGLVNLREGEAVALLHVEDRVVAEKEWGAFVLVFVLVGLLVFGSCL